MKTLALTFLWLLLHCVGIAQNKLTEELKRQLAATQEDTSRVMLMAELGLQFRNTNPDSSIFYGQKALTLAEQIKYLRGEAFAINTIALAMREKGDLPKALELTMKAYKIGIANNYVYEAAVSVRRIGLVYMDLKEHRTSLKYLQKALQLSESIQHKKGMGIEYMNIGMTYEYMSILDSALYFIEKAENSKEYMEDLYPEVNRVFGNINTKKGDPKLALFYYHKGIDASSALNDFRTLSFIYADVMQMLPGCLDK